jgi:alkanesulfonate monooxygenase SsuD/methylene tetrahydromethanopterin reductase-like flavin-dependent oxidoreductase (luciferase family)
VNNDSLATAQLMGDRTSRIKVGPRVSSIYMRHSYACAKAASLIADATGQRMVLGLGVSHQPVNAALGVEMSSPTTTNCDDTRLRSQAGYAATVPQRIRSKQQPR